MDQQIFNEELYRVRYAVQDGEKSTDGIDRVCTHVLGDSDSAIITNATIKETMLRGLFVPGGRIWAMAGRKKSQMMNCFVIPVQDSRTGIVNALGEMFEVQALGGGVGYNFSDLRSRGSRVSGIDSEASGPCSFIDVFDSLSHTISGTNNRKAANMGILNVSHPDIMEFIDAKAAGKEKRWSNFNVSVGIDDEDFIQAVLGRIPISDRNHTLWRRLMQRQWECGDPAIINFVRIWDMQNTWYLSPDDRIIATNPCGEIPLPAYGACDLGAVNLSNCIVDGQMDYTLLRDAVTAGVVFLDRVLDTNYYPLDKIREQSLNVRRIGLGTMGLAHALIKCGVTYGFDASISLIDEWYKFIALTAYRTSIELARQYGSFPAYDERLLQSGYMRKVIGGFTDIFSGIEKYGLRNSHILTQAPTGGTSLLVNTSSGIEPIFARKVRRRDTMGERVIVDPVIEQYERENVTAGTVTRTANEINYMEHLRVQEAVQKWVDQSVSKTINLPNDATVDDIDEIFKYALRSQWIKGVTVFRDGCLSKQVLTDAENKDKSEEKTQTKVDIPVSRLTVDEVERGKKKELNRVADSIVKSGMPKVMNSVTHKFNTPQGTTYVTVASDGAGVKQIFIKSDKVGTDNHAWANALGRVLSIALQTGSDAVKLAKTLINCQSSGLVRDDLGIYEHPIPIKSIPDAIGKLLMYYEKENQLDDAGDVCPVCGGGMQPDGGCSVCTFCGYSPCT